MHLGSGQVALGEEGRGSGTQVAIYGREVRKRAKAFRLSINEAWPQAGHGSRSFCQVSKKSEKILRDLKRS